MQFLQNLGFVSHFRRINVAKELESAPYDPVNQCFTTVDGVPVRKIYVANISRLATKFELGELFSCYGTVKEVIIIKKKPYEDGPSFGFVTFSTPQEAAKSLNGGRSLFCRRKKLYVSAADSWHQPKESPDGTIIWDPRTIPASPAKEELDESIDNEEEIDLVVQDPVDCPIARLNDDCLLLIFNRIPIHKRITLGQVCRRWRQLNSFYWQNIKTLNFTAEPLNQIVLTNKALERYLTLCPNVTVLNIAQDGHKLQPSALVTIAKSCKNLEELTFRNIPIQKRSLALLAQSCPNLSAFYMEACVNNHDHEMSTLVNRCKKLEKIGVKYSHTLSGAWLRHIKSPLKSLCLEMYEFNPVHLWDGIQNVQSTLKVLSFVSCANLRARDLHYITVMLPELKSLQLAGMFSLFKYKSLYPITKLKNLISLDLEQNMVVSNDFIKELVENCPSLKQFKLSGVENEEFGEKGLSHVAKLTELTHLGLACIPTVNDKLLKCMAKKLTNLQHLELMGCPSVSDEGCVDILRSCKMLETLDISGCSKITNVTILTAVEIASESSRKRMHIVAGATGVTAEDWFSDPDVMRILNIDLSSTILSHANSMYYINNFYDSEYEPSDMDDDDDDDSIVSWDESEFEFGPFFLRDLDIDDEDDDDDEDFDLDDHEFEIQAFHR